jgi:serine phosphatase RsbU (regulator of sigma subunit)/Tfp pilus assembly protein PilF
MQRIFLFILFIYFNSFLYANEQQKADSIFKSLKNFDDTMKITKLVDFVTSEAQAISNPNLSLELLQIAKKLSEEKKIKNFIPKINIKIALVYIRRADYNNANDILTKTLKAMPLADTFLTEKCDIFNYIGLIQRSLGNYELAIKHFYQSLEIAEKLNDNDKIAVCHTNIGGIYYYQDNYNDAVSSFEKAKNIRLKMHDSAGVAGLENNMGALLLEEKKFKEALKNFKQAYVFYETKKIERHQATVLNNIARCYIGLKQNSEAMNYLHLALVYAQKAEHKPTIINSNYLMGDIYQAQNKYLDALLYYKKSLDLAREDQLKPLIRDLYKKMAETENLLGNFKNAYHYHTLYTIYQDSILNENTNKQIAEIQEKYESEKKEKEIESLSKEKLLQEVEINKKKNELNTQKNIRNYSFMGLGILALSFLLLYLNYSTKKKSAKILEEKNKEIETKNKDITDSIQYASRIQNAILPSLNDIKKTFSNSFVLYKPKDIVAGDFYWMETISSIEGGLKVSDNHPSSSPQGENLVIIAAADCTGHGVPGAMVSVVCSNALNRAVKEYQITEPAKILDKTRELVIEHFSKNDSEVKDGMDISLCKIELSDSGKYSIEWAGANNSLWICRPCNSDSENKINASSVVSNNNFDLFEIAANKQPIGNFINKTPFTNHLIELQKGDSIFLFTDGFADQFGGEKGKKLKSSNFKKLLLSIQHENMNKQLQMLNDAFDKWKGNFEQVDDVCVIGIKIT